MLECIENFIRKISALTEEDYGDFMRTANLYLNTLRTELAPIKDNNIHRKISEMQSYLQFASNWDVRLTREKLLKDAEYIEDLLYAHIQDWESACV